MLPASALYIALASLLFVLLSANVSRLRIKHQVSTGTGERSDIHRATRAHGNLAEVMAPFVALLLLCELCGGNGTWLHVAGGSFVTARLLHAYGMIGKNHLARQASATLTLGIIAGMSGWLLSLGALTR